MELVGSAIHHRTGPNLRCLAIHQQVARAFGDHHEFFFRMLVRRVGAHAGFQLQAAGGHGGQLIGGSIEIDTQVAERLFG